MSRVGAARAAPVPLRSYGAGEWSRLAASTPLRRCDLNALVLDYLVSEGHVAAAAAFAADTQPAFSAAAPGDAAAAAGVPPHSPDLALASARRAAARLVRAGDAAGAAAALEASLPGVTAQGTPAGFALRLRGLLQAVARGDVAAALAAAPGLGAEAGGDEARVDRLESALALLAYTNPADAEAALPGAADMLGAQGVEACVREVRAAALAAAGRLPRPLLAGLLLDLAATHEALAAAGVTCPRASLEAIAAAAAG